MLGVKSCSWLWTQIYIFLQLWYRWTWETEGFDNLDEHMDSKKKKFYIIYMVCVTSIIAIDLLNLLNLSEQEEKTQVKEATTCSLHDLYSVNPSSSYKLYEDFYEHCMKRLIFKPFNKTNEWFLKDHVTLKIKIYSNRKQLYYFTILLFLIILHFSSNKCSFGELKSPFLNTHTQRHKLVIPNFRLKV